jgi:hypothetical protein
MSKILKKMLLLVLISTAILVVSALADQTTETNSGKYTSEKYHPLESCDKCNYNCETCKVACCDFEYCLKCGEKHYADGYCDKCGEKCTLYKYCPNDKRFYPNDGDHYCTKCGAFCYYIEHCDKCGYNYKYDGYCDSCHKKCYFDQCCYMKCNNECKEPCRNCYETPVKEVTPTSNENTNYDMGTTGYPAKSADYNTQGETTQPAQQTY